MMMVTNLKKLQIGSKGTHLLKLKQEIRIKANTMQQHACNQQDSFLNKVCRSVGLEI